MTPNLTTATANPEEPQGNQTIVTDAGLAEVIRAAVREAVKTALGGSLPAVIQVAVQEATRTTSVAKPAPVANTTLRTPHRTGPPGVPDLAMLPRRVDRKAGAALVSAYFFTLSHRTLEAWPLAWQHVNGRATCSTEELLREAQRRLDAAPAIRGGRRPANHAA